MVYLNVENIRTHRPTAKLNNANLRLFTMKTVYESNPLIVKLDLPDNIGIYSIFYVNLLTRAGIDPLLGQIIKTSKPKINDEIGDIF